MDSLKYKVTWKTFALPAIGIAAFIIYLYIFNVDIGLIISTAQTTNLPVYFIAMAFVPIEVLFFSLSWRQLLSFLSVKLTIAKAYLYVWYGMYIDTIIPAESVSGEITRAYLVTREMSGKSGEVVASLMTHRLLGMGINITSLLVGVAALLAEKQISGLVLNLALFLLLTTTVILVFLVILSLREKWTLKIMDAVVSFAERVSRGRWRLARLRNEAQKATRIFHDSMREFGRAPKTIFVSVILYIVSWLFSLGIAYSVLLSLKYPVSWSVVIVTTSIVVGVKAIPIGIPFEVGLPEITMTSLYIVLGVPFSIAATATVLNRVLTLWLRFFLGFVAQQWVELKALAKPKTDGKAAFPS